MKDARRAKAGPTRARPKPTAFSLHGAPEPSATEDRWLVRAAMALAAALAIALLVMVLGPHRIGDYFTETDFYGAYAEGAQLVQQGRLIPSRYGVIGPGYEVMLALAGFVVRDLFLAAELLSLVATVAVLLLWFFLLRERAGARVAFAAAAFMATNAFFFRHGYGALTDGPAIALQAGALLLLLGARRPLPLLLGGLLAGFAFLTRYNSIALLPAAWIIALLGGTRFAPRLRAALLYSAGFLLPVVPWVLYSLAHGGTFALQLHHNIAYEVFARARGITWDDYQKTLQPQFHSLADVIARDPGAVASQMLVNVGDHLKRDALQLLGWPVAVTAGLGVLLGLRGAGLQRLWPLGIAGGLLFLTLVPVFYSERYSLALLPFYAALAGLACGSATLALAVGRVRRVWLKAALALLPLGAAVAANAKLQARVVDQLPVEVLDCAHTLRELRKPGDKVIARKWHIAYHGGIEGVGFPFTNTLPELAAYAHRGNARWLYVSWPEVETRPQYGYLLDTSVVVPGLTVRHVTRPHPAVLYEIGPDFGRVPAWYDNDTLKALHNTYAQVLVNGRNTAMLLQLGRLATVTRDYERARWALQAAANLEPRNVDVLLALGNVLIITRDGPAARSVFHHILAFDPGNASARLGLGWASFAENDVQAAGDAWRGLIDLADNRQTLYRMVEVFQRLGDRDAEERARAKLAAVGG